jgi:hypothetical protein
VENDSVIRCFNDDTVRAILSTKYSPIDNLWLIEVLNKAIPDGLISHCRGDSDTIYANILMPDSIRFDNDSDYGGMFSISNCEIGKRALATRPSLFRAICQNGCIWGKHKGIDFRRKHIGLVMNDELAEAIADNLYEQIPVIDSVREAFLKTRHNKIVGVAPLPIIYSVAKEFNLSNKEADQWIVEWQKEEGGENTQFALINGLTRAGQKFNNDRWVQIDTIAGELVTESWDKRIFIAKGVNGDDVAKFFKDIGKKLAV